MKRHLRTLVAVEHAREAVGSVVGVSVEVYSEVFGVTVSGANRSRRMHLIDDLF